ARAWVKAEGLTWKGSPAPRGSCLDRGGVAPGRWRALALARALSLRWALVVGVGGAAPSRESGFQAGSLRISFRARPRTAAKLREGCKAQAMASQTRTKR